MSDVISRQVAISAICSACGKIDCDKMDKCEKLQLPPANCSEFPNSSDTISRAKAIDGKICIRRSNGVEIYDDYVVPVEYLEQLPPAQPELKKGKWIRNGWAITCSECGYDMPYTVRRFCPNCGADMRTAEQIVHDAIDNTPMAEDAYPGIKERLHKTVDDMRDVTNGN